MIPPYLIALIYFLSFDSYAYSRNDYKHWIDEDKDCQNTRQEVLIIKSIKKVKFDKKGCKVLSGKWYDYYSGEYFTNPNDLDIDHIVPLADVDKSGGNEWSKSKKIQYANDLDVLIPVNKAANRSKGDKDPSMWLPRNKEYQCDYINNWIRIKNKWNLRMNNQEAKFILRKVNECL